MAGYLCMSTKDKHPIALDPEYKIRDNQFWYNDCKFRHLREDKATIDIKIEGLGILTLKHSTTGSDGRKTLSYTIPHDIQEWWITHRGKYVKVELLQVE